MMNITQDLIALLTIVLCVPVFLGALSALV